jgi:hypothetical protein
VPVSDPLSDARLRWLRYTVVALALSVVLNFVQCLTQHWMGEEGLQVMSPRGDYGVFVMEPFDLNPFTNNGKSAVGFDIRRAARDGGIDDSHDWGPGETRIQIQPATVDSNGRKTSAVIWDPDGGSVTLRFDHGEVRVDTP